jgi:hypothetical protein
MTSFDASVGPTAFGHSFRKETDFLWSWLVVPDGRAAPSDTLRLSPASKRGASPWGACCGRPSDKKGPPVGSRRTCFGCPDRVEGIGERSETGAGTTIHSTTRGAYLDVGVDSGWDCCRFAPARRAMCPCRDGALAGKLHQAAFLLARLTDIISANGPRRR